MKSKLNFGVYILALCCVFTLSACNDDEDDNGPEDNHEDPTDLAGTVTDSEGNEYATLIIGDLEWMTEDLRTSSSSGVVECYDEDPANCGIYGNMYNFEAVTQGQDPSTSRIQGICPDGWYLPRRDDFSDMILTAPGGVNWSSNQLKANSDLWFGSGAGNNESGFAALPGGRLGLTEDENGEIAYNFFDLSQSSNHWWVGHIENPDQYNAGTFNLSAGSNSIGYSDMNSGSTLLNGRATACRCVKPV